ncbi:aspartic peptidase domain-containing protein, partial [Blyttiomyces helicus]
GVTFTDEYGDGSAVSGDVYFGPYTFAGATTNHGYFGVTNKEAGFAGQPQGLLGLSFSFGKDGGVTSSVGEVPIVALGLQSFGFYLSNSNNGDSGVFTTNGFDSSHVSGPFDFGYWQFDVTKGRAWVHNTFATLSGLGSAFGSVPSAIADTGTTLVILPTSVARGIWGLIGATDDGSGKGTARIPCSVAQTGPDVSFTFGDPFHSVPASVYVLPNNDGTCTCGFAGGAEGQGVTIFGDLFLRGTYSVSVAPLYILGNRPGERPSSGQNS